MPGEPRLRKSVHLNYHFGPDGRCMVGEEPAPRLLTSITSFREKDLGMTPDTVLRGTRRKLSA